MLDSTVHWVLAAKRRLKLAPTVVLAGVIGGGLPFNVCSPRSHAVIAAEPDTATTDPLPKVQDSEKEKLLAEFHKLYHLDNDEQTVKYIKPPFVPGRMIAYRQWYPDLFAQGRFDGHEDMLSFLALFERDGRIAKPHYNATSDPEGFGLRFVISSVSKIEEEFDDPEKLLDRRIRADFVVRRDASAEAIVNALGQTLNHECGIPVKLELISVERPVIVVSGRLKEQFVANANAPIELYAATLQPDRGEKDHGTFSEFLDDVGRFIFLNRRVISEVQNPPRGEIFWHRNLRARFDDKALREDRAAQPILNHLEEQMGLQFTQESRKIPTVYVRRSE